MSFTAVRSAVGPPPDPAAIGDVAHAIHFGYGGRWLRDRVRCRPAVPATRVALPDHFNCVAPDGWLGVRRHTVIRGGARCHCEPQPAAAAN